MTIRHKGSPGPFTVLVANFTGKKDGKGNPVKARTGFSPAVILSETNNNVNNGFNDSAPAPSTATITVSDATFSGGSTILFIGKYSLISNVDWAPVEGNTAASATALADAISALPGFSAVPAGSDVNVEGPAGLAGLDVTLEAEYNGTAANFTFTPDTGFFAAGQPQLSGMKITK